MDRQVNPTTNARPGLAIDLAVDTSALYWFDPDSGLAIARQAGGDQASSGRLTSWMRDWR